MKWFLKVVTAIAFIALLNSGCLNSAQVLTTVDRTLVPDAPSGSAVRIDDTANFEKNGYGSYRLGEGLAYETRTDLMPPGYDPASVKKAASLLRFFAITDIHITDEESPGQAIVFAPMLGHQGISLYAPLMPYTTQVLDTTIQTINAYDKQKRIDFGLALGDLTNSGQYDEVRWFIDILDGQTIQPFSGGKKDPVPGRHNDYQDEFKATGLTRSIPWYAVVGNHDHFWIGAKAITDYMRKAVVGNTIFQLPNILKEDGFLYSAGTLDGSQPNAPIIGAGRMDKLKTIPYIAADPDRRYLTRSEWIGEFNRTKSLPLGHGFLPGDSENSFEGCYSFLPKPDLPLKVIVLDDTQYDNDPAYQEGIYGHGSLSKGRYEWLMAQLRSGQDSEQLMIIAAHIPIGVESEEGPMSWIPVTPGYMNQKDLIEQLKAFPNLILLVAGHRHLNTITSFVSSDAAHPENGFWQVETKSLREFPEQFRIFDIAVNGDKTVSIIATDVDPVMAVGSQAALGRFYAIASNQIYGLSQNPSSTVFNAILIKRLSPAMQDIIWKFAEKH
jgi:metallophosphoesterase (TIGR03768 family)